ncbi:hypothetical protein DITRI_Ditri05aG0132800 [Diplodiscus trichospermus]
MVSFQAFLFPEMRKTNPELENSSKKRKLEEPLGGDEGTIGKRSKSESRKSVFDMELHLETPLPLERQRYVDIQSGQIQFYNTRTHMRTSEDARRSPEPPSPGHMSLDLELNLPYDSVRKINATDHQLIKKHDSVSLTRVGSVDKKKNTSGGLSQNLSRLAAEEEVEKQEEMVATVCMQCHMLVMLFKSSPACPNCKFMHPPEHGPPKLFKKRLSLLC